MKKIISIVLTITLLFTLAAGLTVSSSAASVTPDYVRIGIKKIDPGSSFTLESDDGFKIYRYENGGSCIPIQSLNNFKGVNVVASTENIIIKDKLML